MNTPLQERVAKLGLGALLDQELLAAFIGDSEPSRATNLLGRFRSLRGIFSAAPEALAQFSSTNSSEGVDSLGPAITLEISLVGEIYRRIISQDVSCRTILSSSRYLLSYLKVLLADLPVEQFRVLFLDNGLGLIADEKMWQGSVAGVAVYEREVMKRALELSAQSMILVHNHPSESQNVSASDVEITKKLISCARTLSMRVHDHLIVAGNSVLSLRRLGVVDFR